MKKALVVASVASMIDQFNMPNLILLKEMGYEIDVATNFEQSGSITSERANSLKSRLNELGIRAVNVPIPRNIFAFHNILKSLKLLKAMLNSNKYDLMHCHSPIGGAIARLAAKKSRKKNGTKVIYTAHGFHFYKGAPIKNWILFYTIEKYCSKFTDVLITINKEDYALASAKMNANQVKYFPGVGIDVDKFSKNESEDLVRSSKRCKLGIGSDDIVLLSVGELNKNKNHAVIIDAIFKLRNPKIKYLIVGKGALKKALEEKILERNLQNQVFLLGYRTDVADLYKSADLFVFPSYREGLSVSIMEAMGSGLACVVSSIRGNTDLIDDKKGGLLCAPNDVNAFEIAIKKLIENKDMRFKFGKYNEQKIKNFSVATVMEKTREIY